MTTGEIAEIQGTSSTSIEDAIKCGLAAADRTIESVRCLWMRGRHVGIGEGSVPEYHVDMLITFVAEDWQPSR